MVLRQVLGFLHQLWQQSSVTGCTLTLLSRCFGPHLIALSSYSSCARLTSALVRHAPLVLEHLTLEDASPPRGVRWRLTLEVPMADVSGDQHRDKEATEQYFHFSEVNGDTSTFDSVLEDDLLRSEPEDLCVSPRSAQKLSVDDRLQRLEALLAAETAQRQALEVRVDELNRLLRQQGPLVLGRQRGTRMSRATSDVSSVTSTPDLPKKKFLK